MQLFKKIPVTLNPGHRLLKGAQVLLCMVAVKQMAQLRMSFSNHRIRSVRIAKCCCKPGK